MTHSWHRTAPAALRSTPAGARTPSVSATNEGHGRRLTAAFEALEAFPALAESRNRLLRARRQGARRRRATSSRDRVRRRAGHRRAAPRQPASTRASAARSRHPSSAVELLSPGGRPGARQRAPRPSTSSSAASGTPRPSASACTPSPPSAPPTASPREVGYEHRDRLLVTALLHDIGKLVLMHAYPGYPRAGPRRRPHARGAHPPRAPRARRRPRAGRRRARPPLGPARQPSPSAIERHHSDDAEGEAAFVRLADMLAHYAQGAPVSPTELLARRARRRPRPDRAALACMYDLPYPPTATRPRHVEPCPLSRARARRAQAPRRGQGLQADRARARRSRPARCARTCTTSTASSAPSTAPRPS